MKIYRLLLSVLLLLLSISASAQRKRSVDTNAPMLFRVYDGTSGGHKFNYDQDGYYPGKRLPVGAESPEGVSLTVLGNIDVYVVSRAFADTLITWQRTNRIDPLAQKDDSVMLSQFYDYYDEYGYKLSRNEDGTYDLRQAYSKAAQLYNKFRDVWNFWGDGPTDFELIIHHKGNVPVGSSIQNGAERHRIRDIIRYYTEGTDEKKLCPLFYDGKVTGVETLYEVSMKPQFVDRVVTIGNTIQFDERVKVAGASEQRIVVNRYIESCKFEEDYEALLKRMEKRVSEEELEKYGLLLKRVLKSVLSSQYIRENWPAFVFPGEKFELAMKRRTTFDLEHDTLYQMRLQTERFFGYNNDSIEDRLYLRQDTLQLDQLVTYDMPDKNRYYHMMHTTFVQDFAHVEGLDKEECPCYRTSDLRFLSLATQYALPDCPPTLPGNTTVETYMPMSLSKEFQSIQREAHLVFEKNRQSVNPRMGNNASELDSLRAIAEDILLEEDAHNRIDTIRVVAISSPEGSSWDYNKQLSGRRASSVSQWVQTNCKGANKAYCVAVDSVATWLDVADIIETFGASYQAEADSIRAVVGKDDPHNTTVHQRKMGYMSGSNPTIDRALQQLRKVQINFVYRGQRETSRESVVRSYKRGANRDHFSAYYYYMLLTSNDISNEEKLQLAREVVNHPYLSGDSYLRTSYQEGERVQPDQWFDLIRPMAANILAIESIRQREYDMNILAPFITPDARINTTVFDIEENRPYKYINADFVIYNQLAMLLGKGDEESLNRADIYLQMFQNARLSDAFREKYHPEDLIDLVMCYTLPSLLKDEELAERIKNTGLMNYYVVQMSQAHQAYLYEEGQIYTPVIKAIFRDCYERLPELKALEDFEREKTYYEAVTEGRYADFIMIEEERSGATLEEAQEIKDQHIDAAIEALVQLFIIDPDMISFCQGNYYTRGIYRNPLYKSQGIDYYLEAVDAYIERTMEF